MSEEIPTSTARTIEVRPVSHFLPIRSFERKLEAAGIVFQGSLKPKRDRALISFETTEDYEAALPLLNTAGISKKRVRHEDVEYRKLRRCAPVPERAQKPREITTDVRDSITPWWKMDYAKQIKRKSRHAEKATGVMPTELIESPIKDGYRNNVAYTAGPIEGGSFALGFRMGGYEDQGGRVGTVEEVPSVSAVGKDVASRLSSYFVSSGQPHYDFDSRRGYWRRVQVREGTGGVLVAVQVFGETVEGTKEAVVESLNGVPELKGVLWQRFDGISNAAPADLEFEVVWGEDHIVEELCGLKFVVQMNSFFQVNTQAAALMYSKVREWVQDAGTGDKGAHILDVCCGTGTISLVLSDLGHSVHGLELVESAVQDADANAKLNEITNVKFVLGKAEDTLPEILASIPDDGRPVIAVVDPPRNGLHNKVLMALKEYERIDNLVYVSCNPDSLQENLARLTGPSSNKYPGTPFVIQTVGVVDMFPHTKHCEVMVKLHRSPKETVEPLTLEE